MDWDSDPEIVAAVRQAARAVRGADVAEVTRQQRLHALLAHARVLCERAADPHWRRGFAASAGVPVRKDTPLEKVVLRSVLARADVRVAVSSEHDWTIVLTGLGIAGVAATTRATRRWLTEEVLVDGLPRRGFDRARAVVKQHRRRERGLSDAEADAENALDALIADGTARPVGAIEPIDEGSLPRGVWVSLNSDASVLARLPMTEAALRSLAVRSQREREVGASGATGNEIGDG